ncbi:MAG: phage BR0599 family protein [Campylobacteraceae bacterium]|jgi:hypothetical protein|nr:phage BR0599 family protein [Campylobacteraceae bacterium]
MELYEFTYNNNTYRYSSGESVTLGGNLYSAQSITRNEIKKNFNYDEASITVPQHLEPAPQFRIMNPSSVVGITIMNENGIKLFAGKIGSCTYNVDKAEATLKLISIQGILKTQIPNRTYSRSCSFSLFGEGCEVNKNAYKLSLTAFTLNDTKTELTASALMAKTSGYYTGGYIEANGEYDYIKEHTGNKLKLLYPFQTAAGTITVYPGCDKIIDTCRAKYNNERNFGGFPYIPAKNPMTEGF